jgi:pimeloyl-ACP methyl ester carboxylesterase
MPSIGRLRYLEAAARQSERFRGTLVLIHAFPLNARMWEPQLELAAGGWRVVAPQLRGFDDGPNEPAASSVGDYAGDIIDLLDALHLDDVVLAGLSLGGYIAFEILRRASSYVRALILADTRAEADTPEGLAGRRRMLELLEAQGVHAVADEMVPKLLGSSTRAGRPDLAEHVRSLILANSKPSIAGAIRALASRPDSTPLLSTLHCPTLVVVGAEDSLTPRPNSEKIHQAIHGSELVAIERAGHLSSLEQPEAFNDVVRRFLTERV